MSSRQLYGEIIYRVWYKLGKKCRKYVQISIDPNEWSTTFYKPILKYIAWVQDNCTEKSYTEFDKNWARNVENMCKYLLTQMSEVQLSINQFWSTLHEFKTTVWRNHTQSDQNRARYVENTSIYIKLYVYIVTHRVLYGQTMYPVLSKRGKKRIKHQHFIHVLL